jgi:hypothetical protein
MNEIKRNHPRWLQHERKENMKKTAIILMFALFFSSSAVASAYTLQEQQANSDLEVLAKEIAELCDHPGFLEFLRSEMVKSKNRENIVELDSFFVRAAKQSDMPEQLAATAGKAKQVQERHKSMNLSRFEGFDLYIPVSAHRAKWKGGKDFIVAVSPYGDDMAIRETVGFTVKDRRKVVLDTAQPPATVVLVIAPCEHETHERSKCQKSPHVAARYIPSIQFEVKDDLYKSVAPTPGNSVAGIRRFYISDVKEPWTRGAPEIKIFYGTKRGSYCRDFYCEAKGSCVDWYDASKTWMAQWSPEYTWIEGCGGSWKNCYAPCGHFDSGDDDRVVIYIYEEDGGSRKEIIHQLYPGVTSSFPLYDGDDFIAQGSVNESNFTFRYRYVQHLGDATVIWHKTN